jgi:hypothetical protein
VILGINNLLYDETTEKIIGAGLLTYLFFFLAAVSTACVLIYLGFYRKDLKGKKGSQRIIVEEPKIISDLSREYIVTYAISLIGFNLLDIRQAVSFGFLILFFAYLYVKYDTIIYNPILELFRYRMFNINAIHVGLPKKSNGEYPVRKDIILITQKKAVEFIDKDIYMRELSSESNLFIEVKTNRK